MARSRKPQRNRTPVKRAAPPSSAAPEPPVGNDDPTEPMATTPSESPEDAPAPVPAPEAAEAPPDAQEAAEAAEVAAETPAADDVPVEPGDVAAEAEPAATDDDPQVEGSDASEEAGVAPVDQPEVAVESSDDAAAAVVPDERPAPAGARQRRGRRRSPTPPAAVEAPEEPPVAAAATNGDGPVPTVDEPETVAQASNGGTPAPEVEPETDAAPATNGDAPETVAEEDQPDVPAAAGAPDAAGDDDETDDEADAEVEADVDAAAADDQDPAAAGAGPPRGTSRQRGLRAALATLPVPEPGPSFWVDIDRSMEELAPLAITARPAIRPISEPPPLSQPSLSDHLRGAAVRVTRGEAGEFRIDGYGDDTGQGKTKSRTKDNGDRSENDSAGATGGGSPGDRDRDRADNDPFRRFTDASRANTRRTAVIAALVVMAILVAGNALNSRSGDDATSAEPSSATTVPSTTATTARPTTTIPSVPGLAADARLTPDGLGPLVMGTTLRDLTGQGVKATVDQPTFVTSGGACYDVKLTGAPDLTLRFRSPDADSGVADPQEGELASIAITIAPGSARVSETGVRLGATEDEVRTAHDGNVETSNHPTNPGGHMMINYAGDGRGVAYGTDGRVVTEIAVGYSDVITQRQGCS